MAKLNPKLSKLRETDPLAYYSHHEHDGVAPFDDPKDDLDKSIREASVFQEFRASIRKYFGIEIYEPEAGEDPPDFYGVMNGQRQSIELTELIDQDFRKTQKRAFKNGLRLDLNTSYGVTRPFWDESIFGGALTEVLRKKSTKYGRTTSNLAHLDILVIHCHDRFLEADSVAHWLEHNAFVLPQNITRAFLLLDYHTETKDYPLFEVG